MGGRSESRRDETNVIIYYLPQLQIIWLTEYEGGRLLGNFWAPTVTRPVSRQWDSESYNSLGGDIFCLVYCYRRLLNDVIGHSQCIKMF